MGLSDADKQRIVEEEKFRAHARSKAEGDEKNKKTSKSAIGCLGCLGVLLLFFVIGSFTSSQKSSAGPTAQSRAANGAVDDATCRQDIKCLGEKFMVSASVRCKDDVERIAKYKAQWTDGFLEPKFSRYRWADQSKGVVTYIGDKVEFQNGFGAFQNMIYECDFDTARDRPIDVRASPGRIPK